MYKKAMRSGDAIVKYLAFCGDWSSARKERVPSEGCPPHAWPGWVEKDPGVESMIQRFGRPKCVHVVRRVSGLYLGKEFPDAYPFSFAPGNVWPGVGRSHNGGSGAVR